MGEELLSAEQAAALLGVKRATLYAYVSRGLLRRVPGEDGRTRRYVRADVLQLRERAEARAGLVGAARPAPPGGLPSLETAISQVDAQGLSLRGRPLAALLEQASFEQIADLLWEEGAPAPWPAAAVPEPGAPLWSARRRLDRMVLALTLDAAADLARFGAQAAADRQRARRLCRLLAQAAASSAAGAQAAAGAAGIAGVLAAVLGGEGAGAQAGLEVALVSSAEHGLDAPTLAVRVAASAGADLHACLLAGLATLSGPQHAGMCDRIARWLRLLALESLPPEVVIAQQLAQGETLPGFHHPAYPAGDPRAAAVLAVVRALPGVRAEETAALADAAVGAAAERGYPPPRLELALVVLCMALGLPADAAATVLAVGRIAGWTAHVLEQRQQEGELSPQLQQGVRATAEGEGR